MCSTQTPSAKESVGIPMRYLTEAIQNALLDDSSEFEADS